MALRRSALTRGLIQYSGVYWTMSELSLSKIQTLAEGQKFSTKFFVSFPQFSNFIPYKVTRVSEACPIGQIWAEVRSTEARFALSGEVP